MPALRALAIAAGTALLTVLPAQDILHYKFDGACAASVINYAAPSPAPSAGTVLTTTNPASAWTTGRFGSALAWGATMGANFTVDSGWSPASMVGSFSWACWLRGYGGGGGFCGLLGNSAGGWELIANILSMRNAGGNSSFTTNAFNNLVGWMHLACVVDAGTRTVTYYFNGQQQPPVPLTGLPGWIGTSTLMIGSSGSFPNARFDIDEFILANRAMSAGEVGLLASAPRAADAPFGATAGPTLLSNLQLPSPGNQGYGLVLNANAGIALSVFGSNHCRLGATALPMNLGLLNPALAGVQALVDADLGTMLFGLSGGATPIALPLPNLPGLSGYSFFVQVITHDAGANQFLGSNAVAIGIGR